VIAAQRNQVIDTFRLFLDKCQRGSGEEFEVADDLVDGLAIAVEAKPNQVERGGRRHSDAGASRHRWKS